MDFENVIQPLLVDVLSVIYYIIWEPIRNSMKDHNECYCEHFEKNSNVILLNEKLNLIQMEVSAQNVCLAKILDFVENRTNNIPPPPPPPPPPLPPPPNPPPSLPSPLTSAHHYNTKDLECPLPCPKRKWNNRNIPGIVITPDLIRSVILKPIERNHYLN
ncbi:WASH complex subunit 1-like [Daktulosphaira vitifoliae]|uniref:WASH complex subunit 1-like n=1 Tax=Daktulosphaira vitifoliae TaxID=58002 RepID=UPI0021A9A59F|nr:WASH complex subunit 1-like [Daktulosphaira vitifoliae]